MTVPVAAFPGPIAVASRPRATATEICVVFGCTVGVPLAGFLWSNAPSDPFAVTNTDLAVTVVFEILIAALLIPWLRKRGWSPGDVASRPGLVDIPRGLGLGVLAVACYLVTWVLFSRLQPDISHLLTAERSTTAVPVSMTLVVLLSIVNPVFEEFLWLGYGISRVEPLIGLRPAAVLSVALRFIVHLYQGPWALLFLLPLGVAFTWYFGRTRRLWPIIVAHALFDAIALVPLAR